MKLDDLAGGAVYVDTNVWYMFLRTDPVHQHTLTTFLGRVVRGAIEAFVRILVLDELFYRLLLARVKDATGRNPLEVLCKNSVYIFFLLCLAFLLKTYTLTVMGKLSVYKCVRC